MLASRSGTGVSLVDSVIVSAPRTDARTRYQFNCRCRASPRAHEGRAVPTRSPRDDTRRSPADARHGGASGTTARRLGVGRWRRPRSLESIRRDAQDPSSFGEPLTRSDALYFTITIFATVGFGDINPDPGRTPGHHQSDAAGPGGPGSGLGIQVVLEAVQRGARRKTEREGTRSFRRERDQRSRRRGPGSRPPTDGTSLHTGPMPTFHVPKPGERPTAKSWWLACGARANCACGPRTTTARGSRRCNTGHRAATHR